MSKGITNEQLVEKLSSPLEQQIFEILESKMPGAIVTNRQRLDAVKEISKSITELPVPAKRKTYDELYDEMLSMGFSAEECSESLADYGRRK